MTAPIAPFWMTSPAAPPPAAISARDAAPLHWRHDGSDLPLPRAVPGVAITGRTGRRDRTDDRAIGHGAI